VRIILRAIFAAGIFAALGAAPVFALSPQSGMPHDPISKSGKCAKASHGVHIPYRGWRTRDRLSYRTCMWF